MLRRDALSALPDSGPVRGWVDWQNAMQQAEIVFPARLLAVPAAAQWIRDQRCCVDVGNDGEIDLALTAGIHPVRMVLQSEYAVMRTIWHAVGLGVGRFVVSTPRQATALLACARGPQRVLVDVTSGSPDELFAEVLAHHQLQLTGLHCQLRFEDQCDDVDRVIGLMVQFYRDHAVILSRISLTVAESPRATPNAVGGFIAAIDDALDSNCRRLRFPRPAVSLSPHWRTLAECA